MKEVEYHEHYVVGPPDTDALQYVTSQMEEDQHHHHSEITSGISEKSQNISDSFATLHGETVQYRPIQSQLQNSDTISHYVSGFCSLIGPNANCQGRGRKQGR